MNIGKLIDVAWMTVAMMIVRIPVSRMGFRPNLYVDYMSADCNHDYWNFV